MEDLAAIGKSWFQLFCAICNSVLQITPDTEIKPMVEGMGWRAIGDNKYLCSECDGRCHQAKPPTTDI